MAAQQFTGGWRSAGAGVEERDVHFSFGKGTVDEGQVANDRSEKAKTETCFTDDERASEAGARNDVPEAEREEGRAAEIDVRGKARMATGDIDRRTGAVLHEAEAEDETDGPDRDEQKKRERTEKAEQGFARLARRNHADYRAPRAPRGFEKQTREAKFARDAARQDDGFERIPQDDEKNYEARHEGTGSRNHVRIVPVPSSETDTCLGDEFGGNGDLRFEEFGYGAAGFGGFNGGVKFGLVGAGDFGGEIEMAFGDGKTIADFFERNGGGGFKLFSGEAGAAELRGESHGETSRVSSSEEFFGICADAVFESRAEGILRLFKDATVRGNRTFARFQITRPDCGSFALHENSPDYKCADVVFAFDSNATRMGT